jgi:uncharacterized protein YcgI (DUF1989 family)
MNIAVLEDGISLATRPVETKPGNFITFRAEMDCVIALSSCPQDIVRIQSDIENKPKDVAYEVLEKEFNDVGIKSTWVPNYSKV